MLKVAKSWKYREGYEHWSRSYVTESSYYAGVIWTTDEKQTAIGTYPSTNFLDSIDSVLLFKVIKDPPIQVESIKNEIDAALISKGVYLL